MLKNIALLVCAANLSACGVDHIQSASFNGRFTTEFSRSLEKHKITSFSIEQSSDKHATLLCFHTDYIECKLWPDAVNYSSAIIDASIAGSYGEVIEGDWEIYLNADVANYEFSEVYSRVKTLGEDLIRVKKRRIDKPSKPSENKGWGDSTSVESN